MKKFTRSRNSKKKIKVWVFLFFLSWIIAFNNNQHLWYWILLCQNHNTKLYMKGIERIGNEQENTIVVNHFWSSVCTKTKMKCLIAACHIDTVRVIFFCLYKTAFYPLPNICSCFSRWISNVFLIPEDVTIYQYMSYTRQHNCEKQEKEKWIIVVSIYL